MKQNCLIFYVAIENDDRLDKLYDWIVTSWAMFEATILIDDDNLSIFQISQIVEIFQLFMVVHA